MVDPVSLGAIGAVLGAVGSGMANEAGKWAWESAGGLVRRIAGGEVAAPTTPGQLYADLRARAPEAVLGTLLRGLGLPDEETPPAAADRAELLRRTLADRRLLLVLDHARSAAQLRPLLTSAPGVVTIVVARQPL